MRNTLSIILLIVIVFVMCGCSFSQEQPEPVMQPSIEDSAPISSPYVTEVPEILAEYTLEYLPDNSVQKYNAKLASERLNGIEIPSGTTFSVMEQLGEISLKNGWTGAPIAGDNDTFWSEITGAGICATTTCLYLCVCEIDPTMIVTNYAHEHPVEYDKGGACVLAIGKTYDFAFESKFEQSLFIQSICDEGLITVRLSTVRPEAEASPNSDFTEVTGSVNFADGTNDLPTMTADNNSLDIKSASEVDFPNSMRYDLPDNLIAGGFDEFLGMGGGVPLLNEEGTICGCIELHLYGSGTFEGGRLVGVNQFANHASFENEFTSVSSGAPCVAVKYARDVYNVDINEYVGKEYLWYAFWAKEGFKPLYAIYLNADLYDYEDLLAIAESVTFSEDAFLTVPTSG